MKSPKDLSQLFKVFKKLYPIPKSELNFEEPYELVISVMLSAQCTDKKVNEVTPTLFKKYGSFKALSKAQLKDIEEIIRPINYYKTKAKHLLEMGKLVTTEFGGSLPRTYDELILLPGVGRKTANVILSELGAAPAFPVDTHIFRLSRRLGLSKGKNVLKVEEDLRSSFPEKDWRPMHHYLIFHGRRVCKARKPLCKECPLNKLCPSAEI